MIISLAVDVSTKWQSGRYSRNLTTVDRLSVVTRLGRHQP